VNPKPGTAGHALQSLADLSRNGGEVRVHEVIEHGPDEAELTIVLGRRRFTITATSNPWKQPWKG
jgi:hypothetical protein